MATWPNADEFDRMSAREQQAVRDRANREATEATAAMKARVADLQGQGATRSEIWADLKGDTWKGGQ